jgi:starch synthase (maltosyl-transferring)
MSEGLRIYNLFPTLVGTVRDWTAQLPRIAAMRFNTVYLNPFHYPGFSGSLYAVKDYYRLNPRLRGQEPNTDDALLRGLTAEAGEHGLKVVMDLVINHTARDSDLVAKHPDWFARGWDGELLSPYAVDPADPTKKQVWGDLAELQYRESQRADIVAYFQGVMRHYLALGFAGFRCDAAYKVPAAVWRELIASARADKHDVLFLAETLGAPQETAQGLAEIGFDYIFNSLKWWDFKSPWLFEQQEAYRDIAPSIAFPESHDTERLVAELQRAGVGEDGIEARCRLAYAFAAFFSKGVMLPVGFEYGWSKKLDVVATRPDQAEPKRFDLSEFIAEVNAVKEATPALNAEASLRLLTPVGEPLVGLLRNGKAAVLVNTDPRVSKTVAKAAIAAVAGGGEPGLTEIFPRRRAAAGAQLRVPPLSVRVLQVAAQKARPIPRAVAQHPMWRTQGRIQIEDVYPELDGGRYPVKRILGESFEVWADIFRDGHDKLRAVLDYAPEGEPWREVPFEFYDNDRWVARITLDRLGRWRYTIAAWTDRFESWREEVEKKRAAGQDVSVELQEGRAVVEAALPFASGEDARQIRALLADGGEALLSPELQALMARAQSRDDAVRYPRELEVVVDREAARFAAWYEMVPRSQGRVPGKSATLEDCIARLPEIARMGFDVVYLPPIHPIGRVNRKGRDNNAKGRPGDPGSPYAIGAEEGGHRAIHPDLGGPGDFRRFVDAAGDLGLEVALDFAVQAAPDHPWVRQHPLWFRFRPDGTIKYAENPPKKYEDIVNVEFHNPERDALWAELRDTVLYWIGEGVHIFRVDNPHTKPLPFWEWLIREVQARHPETIFLSEAFTRPKMMRALAKAGFTQSYTYFTWRNTKTELTEYLTELTQGPAREYFRPNFFTNTPDILPKILQEGGRPAFVMRLALAATLSPAYGIYNGFELCENTAIPGTEEYLHSEKYEYKVWDWDRPGNIKPEIAALNRFRRANPALQEFWNLRLLWSSDPQVLVYAKFKPDPHNLVVAAVNLDPHAAHETDFYLPLDELGLASAGEFAIEEAFTGQRVTWRGGDHHLRLDPATNPAMLFQVLANH